jgi:hypothetical protein
MPTIPLIQILTANGAEPFTIFPTERVYRYLEQGILPEERLQINVGIVRQQKAGIGHRFFTEGVELCKIPVQGLTKVGKAADTLHVDIAMKIALNYEALRGAANAGHTSEISQLKVFIYQDLIKLKGELMGVADFLVNDEADVDSERFSRVSHEAAPAMDSGFRVRKPVRSL